MYPVLSWGFAKVPSALLSHGVPLAWVFVCFWWVRWMMNHGIFRNAWTCWDFFYPKKTFDHFWPGTLLAWLELGFESFRKGDLSTSLRLQTMQNPYEDTHLLEKMRNWTLLNCRDGKECGKPSSLIRSWKREWIDWVSSLFVLFISCHSICQQLGQKADSFFTISCIPTSRCWVKIVEDTRVAFVGQGYVEEIAWELPEVQGDEEDILNLGEVCTSTSSYYTKGSKQLQLAA